MYTLVLQKTEGDMGEFPLTKYLHDFLVKTEAEGIIVWPGYLSKDKDTTEKLLEPFLKDTNIQYFGMGNFCYPEDEKRKNKIPEEYSDRYLSYREYLNVKKKWFKIFRNYKVDHSKLMVIFNRVLEEGEFPEQLSEKKDCGDFLEKIHIIGMVIGSSNFSYNTFYRPDADKGETDLFMFWGEEDGEAYKLNEAFADDVKKQLGYDKKTGEVQDQYKAILFENKTFAPNDYFEKILRAKLEKTLND